MRWLHSTRRRGQLDVANRTELVAAAQGPTERCLYPVCAARLSGRVWLDPGQDAGQPYSQGVARRGTCVALLRTGSSK